MRKRWQSPAVSFLFFLERKKAGGCIMAFWVIFGGAENYLLFDTNEIIKFGKIEEEKQKSEEAKVLLQILKCDNFHCASLFLTLQFIKWCPIQTFSHFRIIRNVADVLMAPQDNQGLQETQEYQASTALQDSRELEGSLVRLEHLVCLAVQRHQTGNNANGRTTIAN